MSLALVSLAMAAMQLLANDSFRYTREIIVANDAALEFLVDVDAVAVHGIDLRHWNDHAQLTEITVMLRPLKAVQLVQAHVAAELQASPGRLSDMESGS